MKVEILVPETLHEITLGQYQAFLDSDQNEISMISIFCNISKQNVKKIKMQSVEKIALHLGSLFTEDYPLIQRFKIAGEEFGFIPKLDDMSFGEYVDLDKMLSDPKEMNRAMGILFRPITQKVKGKYLIEAYSGTPYDLTEMPLSAALGAMVFFWNLGNDLLNAIPNYLNKEVMKMTSQQRASLEKSGVGINQSIHSLKGTLQDLTRLLPSPFINA